MKKALSILSITLLIVTSFSSPSYAGNKKLKRAIAIGTAIGVGAAVIKKIKDKKKKRKSVSNNSNSSSNRSTNKAIQSALNAKGFNAGTPDGVLGKGSRAAISSYQQSIGAEPTGKLTKVQQASLLGVATTTGVASAAGVASSSCTNPMSEEQLSGVNHNLNSMLQLGTNSTTMERHHTGEFLIDKCRNITVLYVDNKPVTGKLHDLFTDLNFQHHDTIYLGLNTSTNSFSLDSNAKLIYHAETVEEKIANWMIEMNTRIEQLLKLAGYENDPKANLRAKVIENDLEELGTPDFNDGLRNLFGAVSANSGANNSGSRYEIIEDNTNQSSQKHMVIKCRNGSRQNVFLESDGGWGTGFMDVGKNSFENTALRLCP